MALTLLIVLGVFCALVAYLFRINDRMLATPPEVKTLCEKPWTAQDIQEAAQHYHDHPTDFNKALPPKTGRRYIIVGGSGMLLPPNVKLC